MTSYLSATRVWIFPVYVNFQQHVQIKLWQTVWSGGFKNHLKDSTIWNEQPPHLRWYFDTESYISVVSLESFVTSGHSDVHTIFETPWLTLCYKISGIKQPERIIQSTEGELIFGSIFRLVPKLEKAYISFIMSFCFSVRPHGTYNLPAEGFSLNFNTWFIFV